MFYCSECQAKNNWPKSISRSSGPCEVCKKIDNCYDLPTKVLARKTVSSSIKESLEILNNAINRHADVDTIKYYCSNLVEEIESEQDVFCNRCAESCRKTEKDYEGKEHSVGNYGLIDCTVSGGFHSSHLNDLTNYEFSLCEKCLTEIFSTFKIPVKER